MPCCLFLATLLSPLNRWAGRRGRRRFSEESTFAPQAFRGAPSAEGSDQGWSGVAA